MKKWLKILILTIFVLAFGYGMGVLGRIAREQRSTVACERLEIVFSDSLRFVGEDDVKGLLEAEYGRYVGERIDSVGLDSIEKMLEGHSTISGCEAWVTGDGVLHISISQRHPAVRFKDGDRGFYADSRGYIFPLRSDYTADVPLVEGALPLDVPEGYRGEAPTEEQRVWILDMVALENYISGSRMWKGRFGDVKVRRNGDIVIAAADGGEQFVLGGPDGLDAKFGRISEYYSHILPAYGAGYYKTVIVKYNNQIICRKDT